MSFKHLSRLQCDTCGAIHGAHPGFDTKRQARAAAKKDGWKRVKHYRVIKSILGTKLNIKRKFYQDHCPACLQTPQGQTEVIGANQWSKIAERERGQ